MKSSEEIANAIDEFVCAGGSITKSNLLSFIEPVIDRLLEAKESAFDKMVRLGKETDAGSVKMIIRKKDDGTPLFIACAYYQSDDLAFFLDDLEHLEEKYGYGQ